LPSNAGLKAGSSTKTVLDLVVLGIRYLPDKASRYLRQGATNLLFNSEIDVKEEWAHPETYIIATNRGLSAFLKLLKSVLQTHNKKITTGTVKKYLSPLKSRKWDYAALSKSYVGSQGWKDFYRDLAKQIKKKHKNFKEIK
jgi:hypothetical protein